LGFNLSNNSQQLSQALLPLCYGCAWCVEVSLPCNGLAVATSSHLCCFLLSYWDSVTAAMLWLCMDGKWKYLKRWVYDCAYLRKLLLQTTLIRIFLVKCQCMVTSNLDVFKRHFLIWCSAKNWLST